ncbi:MAG: methyltransferase domain-containing protein [Gammaproteobacteria bacterium]|nr:methyltransferase domain-containing protein [Gammaproteobacteria bacterium]
MALIWSKECNGKSYEVRSAGLARRLYTDGVLHSAYHPDKPLTGSIWDLLLLPALFFPLEHFKRILVLGAGAGSILHLLNQYLNPQTIIAIDCDDIHLSVAKRFFAVRFKNVQLIHDDAIAWVQNYSGEPFDLIIEDLFVEEDGLPIRLMHDDVSWLDSMLNTLTEDGLLVINNGDISEARFTRAHLPRRKKIRQFSMPMLQNRVLAFPAEEKQNLQFQKNICELRLSNNIKQYTCRLLKTNSW